MAITNFQVAATTGTEAFEATADTAVTVIYITNKTDGELSSLFTVDGEGQRHIYHRHRENDFRDRSKNIHSGSRLSGTVQRHYINYRIIIPWVDL